MTEIAKQSWSLVVLCYNEAGTIKSVIDKCQVILKEISIGDGEIVVVNDGSSDNSDAIIRELLKDRKYSNVKYCPHDGNKGIGQALRTGYGNATGENVVPVPGDGQFDLKELIPYKNVADKSFVSFYRVENTTYTLTRNILSWVNQMLNKFFIGMTLKDVNWVKAYKTTIIQNLNLEIQSSLMESEICSKMIYLGHKPIEVKSKYLPREAGESKGASFKIVKQAILDIFRLIFVMRRFKKELKKKE